MKYTSHYELNKPENSDQFNVEHFNENATKIDNALYQLDQNISPVSAHITNQNNPHNVTKAQVGLGNVDNTSDANKPISTAMQNALDLKANSSSLGTAATKDVPTSGNASDNQVVLGNDSRLSDSRTPTSHTHTTSQITDLPTIPTATSDLTNDSGFITSADVPTKTSDLTNDSGFINYKAVSTTASQGLSDTEKANARTNIGAGTSNFDGTYSSLIGTPTLGTASSLDVASSGDASSTQIVKGDDSRLTDSRTPTSHTHTASDITDFPTLATVATSGSYNDLSNKPTIPTKTSDLTNDSGFIDYKAVSTVANQGLSETEKANARTNIGAGSSTFSGDYNDLTNKPALGTVAALNVATSGDASTTEVVKGDDSRLTDSRTPTSHTHTTSDITNLPSFGTAASLDVATSGDASSTQVVKGDDSRLTDSRTPTSHTHTVSEITDMPSIQNMNEQYYQTSEPSPSKTGAVWIG